MIRFHYILESVFTPNVEAAVISMNDKFIISRRQGLDSIVAEKAGAEFVKDCEQKSKRLWKLGSAAATTAGKMKRYKCILHVIALGFGHSNSNDSILARSFTSLRSSRGRVLSDRITVENSVRNVILLAESLNLKSIAIPVPFANRSEWTLQKSPAEVFTKVIVETAVATATKLEDVFFCQFDDVPLNLNAK
jgi:hypothetical protein